MQLAPTRSARLIPAPKASADHADFDVLGLTRADGSNVRVGLVPGQRFFVHRGRSFDDAVAGAQELAAKSGVAQAILAAHPGMLFVVPAFLRDNPATPTSGGSKLGAQLETSLAGLTTTNRHGVVWALVGADQVIDMRQLPATLGSAPD